MASNKTEQDTEAKPTKDDDDDEFFGNQDEDDDFGALGRHDQLARNHELRTIGYFESYDETKESLLQRGFEGGYRETYDAALRLGKSFGRQAAETHLLRGNDSSTEESSRQAQKARRIYEFLTEYQKRPNNNEGINAKQSIELLERELFTANGEN